MDERLLKTQQLRGYYLDTKDSNGTLAKVCLTYLGFKSFSHWQAAEYGEPKFTESIYKWQWWDEYSQQNPLLEYATRYWPSHFRGAIAMDKALHDLMCRLLHPNKTPNFLLWLRGYTYCIHVASSETASTLHIAATLGFTEVCKWLIKRGIDINFRDKTLDTPLICAIRGKFKSGGLLGEMEKVTNMATIKGLLEAGAYSAGNYALSSYSACPGDFSLTVTPMSLALGTLCENVKLGTEIFRILMDTNSLSPFENSSFWGGIGDYMDPEMVTEAISLFQWTLNHEFASALNVESTEKMIGFITEKAKFCNDELPTNLEANSRLFQSPDSIVALARSAAYGNQINVITDFMDKKVDHKLLSKVLPAAASSGSSKIVDALLRYCPPDDEEMIRYTHEAWSKIATFPPPYFLCLAGLCLFQILPENELQLSISFQYQTTLMRMCV